MTYDTSYPTRTERECDDENRAAREAETRRELRNVAAFILEQQPLRVRMNDALAIAATIYHDEHDHYQLDPLYFCECGNMTSVGAWTTNCPFCEREIN